MRLLVCPSGAVLIKLYPVTNGKDIKGREMHNEMSFRW